MWKFSLSMGYMALTLVILCSQSFALQMTLVAGESAVITNPESPQVQRLLTKYEIPALFRSAEIIYAQLEASVSGALGAGEVLMGVQAAPLITDWSAGTASWSGPWREPGGDADFRGAQDFFIRQGANQVRIDVTRAVKQWVHGARPNYGLILRMSPSSTGCLSLPGSTDREGTALPDPIIRVWYLPTPD